MPVKTLPEPLTVTALTDQERIALSYAYHGRHLETRYGDLVERPRGYVQSPEPPTVWEAQSLGGLNSAQDSLVRLGLLESFHVTRYTNAKGEAIYVENFHITERDAENFQQRGYRIYREQPGLDYEERIERYPMRQSDTWTSREGWSYAGWGYGAGWNYRLTDLGREWLTRYHPYTDKCCDGCVQLPCVCRIKTFCAIREHPQGCRGSHD